MLRSLRSIDKFRGGGISLTLDEMHKLIHDPSPNAHRKELSEAVGLSEAELMKNCSEHLKRGETMFSCVGFADIYLAQ